MILRKGTSEERGEVPSNAGSDGDRTFYRCGVDTPPLNLTLRVSYHQHPLKYFTEHSDLTTAGPTELAASEWWCPKIDEILYEIKCGHCPKVYIEQTGRSLSQHLAEHKRAVKSAGFNSSALVEYA